MSTRPSVTASRIESAAPGDPRDSTFIDTVIIGAGQAGLATARQLTRRRHPCVVLEANEHVGDNWRQRYDSLRLFTPNSFNKLPGMAFPDRRWGFAGKDAVGDYLETYAERFELPVRLGTEVTRLERKGPGFRIETVSGRFECHNVVIATSPHGRVPSIPSVAAQLDQEIRQLHSSEYRRPSDLPGGPVLVVGAGHSGCDIALELARTHEVTLAGRDPGEIPVPWDSPLLRIVLPTALLIHRHVRTRRTPFGRRQRPYVLAHGGPMLRVKRADLAAAGVARTHARVTGSHDGLPELSDGSTVSPRAVVWATGFRHDFSWLDLPVLDDSGWPREYRGVCRDVEGLFFAGLAYQYAFASMDLHGVGRDAAYVARRILRRTRRSEHRTAE